MTFAYDIRSNLLMLVDLLNTSDMITGGDDELATATQLNDFAARHDFSGPLRATKSDAEAARNLRERLTRAVDQDTEAVVAAANFVLREASALPQLVRHDDWDWHLRAVGSSAHLADRVGADVALVLIDLIRGGDLDRLGRCAAEGCDAFLADFSRNHSKRFCDIGNCASRTHVAAFRARQEEAEENGISE